MCSTRCSQETSLQAALVRDDCPTLISNREQPFSRTKFTKIHSRFLHQNWRLPTNSHVIEGVHRCGTRYMVAFTSILTKNQASPPAFPYVPMISLMSVVERPPSWSFQHLVDMRRGARPHKLMAAGLGATLLFLAQKRHISWNCIILQVAWHGVLLVRRSKHPHLQGFRDLCLHSRFDISLHSSHMGWTFASEMFIIAY